MSILQGEPISCILAAVDAHDNAVTDLGGLANFFVVKSWADATPDEVTWGKLQARSGGSYWATFAPKFAGRGRASFEFLRRKGAASVLHALAFDSQAPEVPAAPLDAAASSVSCGDTGTLTAGVTATHSLAALAGW